MEGAVLACAAAAPGAAGGGGAGAGGVVSLKRSAFAACLTCPLCGRLLRDAATITECLHTFCRKCISEEFVDKEVCCCPICGIDLGCAPLGKLRTDHSIEYVRSKIFPKKQKTCGEVDWCTPAPVAGKSAEHGGAPDQAASPVADAEVSEVEIVTVQDQVVAAADGVEVQQDRDPHASVVERQNRDAMVFALDDDAVEETWKRMALDVDALTAALGTLREKGAWDRLAEEARMRGRLTEQLADARREVAVLERSRAAWKQERDQQLARSAERLRDERDWLAESVGRSREALATVQQGRTNAIVLAAEMAKQVQAAEAAIGAHHVRIRRAALDDKVTAEVVRSRALEKELSELRSVHQQESDDHGMLRGAVQAALDDLGMTSLQGSSSLAARVPHIAARARGMATDALHLGVRHSFAISLSFYKDINLEWMSQGFADGYTEAELDEIEEHAAPFARVLAAKFEEEVVPPKQ